MSEEQRRRRAMRNAYIAFDDAAMYVMTVGELVERLSAFDPASPVVIEGVCPHDGGYVRELDVDVTVDQGPTPDLDEVVVTWVHDDERERLYLRWSEEHQEPPRGSRFP